MEIHPTAFSKYLCTMQWEIYADLLCATCKMDDMFGTENKEWTNENGNMFLDCNTKLWINMFLDCIKSFESTCSLTVIQSFEYDIGTLLSTFRKKNNNKTPEAYCHQIYMDKVCK